MHTVLKLNRPTAWLKDNEMLNAGLISYPNLFGLATAKMISSHFVDSGPDYVKLNWTQPKFLPERYQVTYVCILKPTCTPSPNTSRYIVTRTQNLSSDTTSITVSNLHQRSTCMLILLAVYNPASIDTGIAIAGATLDEDAREIYSGLQQFRNILVVYFFHLI